MINFIELKKSLWNGRLTVNKKFKEDILSALNDDMNSAKAMSIIDEMISNANDKLDVNPKDKNLKKNLFQI